jgi:Ca2+-binding RTX toxin-like protein
MLGLKHPFEGTPTLPTATDDTAHTLMSYTEQGGPYAVFSEYDIAAINWLYGHDGLGGALGINSTTGARYLTGSSAADSLTGTAFNDKLDGSSGNDTLSGGAGNDTLAGGAGNDVISGGTGVDTVSEAGGRSSYTITKSGTGYQLLDARVGADGTDIVSQVETLAFSDATLSVEYDDAVQALYVAYFGRAADFSGLANFQAELVRLGAPHDFSSIAAAYGSNTGIAHLIDTFGSSAESAALYSGDTRAFVTGIYNNVLNRAPDTDGLNYWAGKIDRSEMTRTNAAISIMSGALSNTTAQGLIDGALVTNKTTIASNFSLALNSNVLSQAYAGDAAAATVRSMLGTISASTDVTAFQSTINSTLSSLVNSHTASSEAPVVLTLIGHADASQMLWLA